jgi:hypothetical protein
MSLGKASLLSLAHVMINERNKNHQHDKPAFVMMFARANRLTKKHSQENSVKGICLLARERAQIAKR